MKYNSTVRVNGQVVGGCFNGYNPFELGVTPAARSGQADEVLIGLTDWTGLFSTNVDFSNLAPGDTADVELAADWSDARLWDLEDPHLYQLETTLAPSVGPTDTLTTRFGFREFRPAGGSLFLNGVKRHLHARDECHGRHTHGGTRVRQRPVCAAGGPQRRSGSTRDPAGTETGNPEREALAGPGAAGTRVDGVAGPELRH